MGVGVLRGVVVPVEVCPDVAAPRALAAAAAAADWLGRAQHPDGSFVYRHDRQRGDLGGYHVVRHAGVTLALYQLAERGDGRALATADRAMAWMRQRLVERRGWAALVEPGSDEAQLGATALLAAAMLERRAATGDTDDDLLLRALGRFVVQLQEPDGAFLDRYDLSRDRPVPGGRSAYSRGEAFWAVTRLDRVFPGEGWRRVAIRASHVIASGHDGAEPAWFAPWPDQWSAYALGDAGWRLSTAEVAYARRLAERFGLELRVESQRESNPVARLVRGGRIVGAGLGVEVEGMSALWRLAGRDRRLADLRPAMAIRARCGAGLLVRRQERSGRHLVGGAWYHRGVTQMDDQQHGISALLAAAAIGAD